MISVAIIEDEPLALGLLKSYIEKVPELRLAAAFTDPQKGIIYLKKNKIDLLFLDIQMPELTGIEVTYLLNDKPDIIFTTAYEKYALKGFEVNALDYLLKPITFERFIQSIDKVIGKSKPSLEPSFFFVKSSYSLIKVIFSNIQYLESANDYTLINTITEQIKTSENIKDLEKVLSEDSFVRVHRSFIVQVNHINKIEKNRIIIGNKYIPIGASYKDEFMNRVKNITNF